MENNWTIAPSGKHLLQHSGDTLNHPKLEVLAAFSNLSLICFSRLEILDWLESTALL